MTSRTLAQQLQPFAIALTQIETNYRPMLGLAKELLGVVPNCDPLLEIWPVAFRSYNLLFPNCLNLPFSMWGWGVPASTLGLAMYAASRVAKCDYCTAHTCSFAMRRGVNPQSLIYHQNPQEAAVVAVAEGISRIPSDLTPTKRRELAKYFSPPQMEWIVLSVGMMGFLNKFMDAAGVELETESIDDVASILTPTGWTPGKHAIPHQDLSPAINRGKLPQVDNITTYLRLLKHLPGAIALEKKWTDGIPTQYPKVGEFLLSHTGHNFPLLSKLSHQRAIRALTTSIYENLNPRNTSIGISTKCLTGLVYANYVENQNLIAEAIKLTKHWAPKLEETIFTVIAELSALPLEKDIHTVQKIATNLSAIPGLSSQDVAAIILARAAAPSPAAINSAVLEQISPFLTSSNIVEILIWLSIQQLLHRIDLFYDLDNE